MFVRIPSQELQIYGFLFDPTKTVMRQFSFLAGRLVGLLLKPFPCRANFFPQPRTYIYVLDASTRTHSFCTSATKEYVLYDVYIRPLTVSRETKIFSCQQPRTYIYVLHVLRQQPTTYMYVLIKGLIDVWLLDVYFFRCSITFINLWTS